MWVGVGGVGVALLCGFGFVAATVRADERVHAIDPAATSGFRGAPRVWALTALVLVLGSLALLVDAAVTPS